MMYQLTVEKRCRVMVQIEVQDDEDARLVAQERYEAMEDAEFENGNVEYDYSLSDEAGRTLVDWN